MYANADVNSPTQGSLLQGFLMGMLRCIAEEEACFDVCDDQAAELAQRDDVSEGAATRFYNECSSVCWNNCFGEEEKD